MSITASPESTAAATRQLAPPDALFSYTATRHDLPVMQLDGFETEEREIAVKAELYPVHAPGVGEPQRWSHVFPTLEVARKFADEALITFEYLGCDLEILVGAPAKGRRLS